MSDSSSPGAADPPEPGRPPDPQSSVPTGEELQTSGPGVSPDGIPEWEPLTPELVEDEAIRGDFVMRWAVVGLAILLGCSQIAETKTLVHIRSGEFLAANGFLPPAHDYLAYTRAGKPWVNLSWLFDLLAAGVYGLGGGIALSIVQAVMAATAFGLLVHTVRAGIRTWWGSICAALTLLACFRQFTIQPELITLLGVSATLYWLFVLSEGAGAKKFVWVIIPVLWCWSQLDAHAYWGWGLLLLYGAGEALGTLLGRPGFCDAGQRRTWWMIAGAACLAAILHPFTWRVWTAPGIVYGLEFPAWRLAYPVPLRSELGAWSVMHPHFQRLLNHEDMAALYLACAALVTLLLNRRRTTAGQAALWIGANLLPLLASHELAAASLVNCALATVNAQEWYLARSGQTYSIQWSFLLFSRGGRAATVLGMFAFAWLIISGRIDGPNGKRTGLGFDDQLLALIDGYEQAILDVRRQPVDFDDRPFPFVVRQGDLLIWAGQKTFIDSRLELYASGGDDSLLNVHLKTRAAIRSKQREISGSGDKAWWKAVFDQYQITHVAVRMSGLSASPNYRTFDELLKSNDWKLTRLTSALAVFYRTDLRQNKELKAWIDAHRLDLVRKFREEELPVPDPQLWPAPLTAYQQVLSLPKSSVPGDVSQATHYIHYSMQDNLRMTQRLAALQLALRSARAGARKEPNSASAYRALGAAYSLLDQLENLELRTHGVALPHLLRYYQIVASYQSALLLDPADADLHQEVAGLYRRLEKVDLMLRHLQELVRLHPAVAPVNARQQAEQLDEVSKLIEQLDQRVGLIRAEVDKQLQANVPRMNLSLWAYQNGAVLLAIDLLEFDRVALAQSPPAQVMLAGWLIEAGRVEQADQMLRGLTGPQAEELPGWREHSTTVAWIQGDYARAAKLCEDAIEAGERNRVSAVLSTAPLASAVAPLLPEHRYPWMHAAALEQTAARRADDLATQLVQLALCWQEQGDITAAKSAWQRALNETPDTSWRPLIVTYWQSLTNELLDPGPPVDQIPITGDLFAEETGPKDE